MKKKQKLLQKSLKEEVEEIIYDYKVYWENINKKKLKNGKFKEVNRNEALHSWLRAKNARLIRKTKAYSKSLNMLKYSLAIGLLL